MKRPVALKRGAAQLTRWTVPALFTVAAASAGVHTVDNLSHALTAPSTRAWLVELYGLLRTGVAFAFAVFTVGRAAPRRPSRSPVAFAACAAAVAAVIAFTEPGPSTPEGVVLAGEVVAVAFCIWLFVSVIFLGRCFGVLPEARGLVTAGPYGLVRHPIYLGEIGACAGLAIAAPSPRNAGVMVGLIVAQTIRMRLEERALTEAFPEYTDYAAATPRLVPRLSLLKTARILATADALPERQAHEAAPTALAQPASRT
jgi:protein-S-isoprenylcysteine O-methyltransferase Ste14